MTEIVIPADGPPLWTPEAPQGERQPTQEYYDLHGKLGDFLTSDQDRDAKAASIRQWLMRNGIEPSAIPPWDVLEIIVASDYYDGGERWRNARCFLSLRHHFLHTVPERDRDHQNMRKWMGLQLDIDETYISKIFPKQGLLTRASITPIPQKKVDRLSQVTGDHMRWLWDGLMWPPESVLDESVIPNERALSYLNGLLDPNFGRYLPDWMVPALESVLSLRHIISYSADGSESENSFYGVLQIDQPLPVLFHRFLDCVSNFVMGDEMYALYHVESREDLFIFERIESLFHLALDVQQYLDPSQLNMCRYVPFTIQELEFLKRHMAGFNARLSPAERAISNAIFHKVEHTLRHSTNLSVGASFHTSDEVGSDGTQSLSGPEE